MDEGLTYREAHEISREEMLLLLAQWDFRREAEFLREENNRFRFSMGEKKDIERALDSLERRRMKAEQRFYGDIV